MNLPLVIIIGIAIFLTVSLIRAGWEMWKGRDQ